MAYDAQQYNEILNLLRQAHHLQYQYWLQHEFFSWQWWTLLGLLIIPWIIWWKLVDKSKVGTILAYGIYIMFIVTAMDAIGSAMQLWIYPIKLFPVVPDSVGIDWGLLTVSHMLIYQYFPRWKLFIAAETSFAAILAFIGEPLAALCFFYLPLHWHHAWSFPIYIMKAVIGKWMIEKLVLRK